MFKEPGAFRSYRMSESSQEELTRIDCSRVEAFITLKADQHPKTEIGLPILQRLNSCNSSWRSHRNMVQYRAVAQHPWLSSLTSSSWAAARQAALPEPYWHCRVGMLRFSRKK